MVEVIDQKFPAMSGSVKFEQEFFNHRWKGINVTMTSLPLIGIDVVINVYGMKL